MSHGPTVCSRSTFFNGLDEGTARTQDRTISCENGSQCNSAPQGRDIGSKIEPMAGKRCKFSLCQTDNFAFSAEIDQTSACGITLTPEEGRWFSPLSSCYYFESPSGRQVVRFDTDLEPHKPPDISPNCRLRCCMFSNAECEPLVFLWEH